MDKPGHRRLAWISQERAADRRLHDNSAWGGRRKGHIFIADATCLYAKKGAGLSDATLSCRRALPSCALPPRRKDGQARTTGKRYLPTPTPARGGIVMSALPARHTSITSTHTALRLPSFADTLELAHALYPCTPTATNLLLARMALRTHALRARHLRAHLHFRLWWDAPYTGHVSAVLAFTY